MLYGITVAKLIFPLLSLPYLTRVLSVEIYGGVAFVKSLMSYMQVIIDFGFLLSGTKEIAECQKNNKKIGDITGNITLARLIISFLCFVAVVIFSFTIPILTEIKIYTYLSYLVVVLSVFLFDYLFRGIEKMEIITIRYVMMRGISTILTFFIVKEDKDILMIPILDMLTSLTAIFFVAKTLIEIGIKIKISSIKDAIIEIKISFIYFISNMATTIFGALTTVIIGTIISSRDVAYWSVCMQLVSAAQALYTPITDSIYPEMIKSKQLKSVIRLAILMFPVLLFGSIFTYVFSDLIITTIAGADYILAGGLMKFLTPVLFCGFYSILFGWPTLGAINKTKQVTLTTILSAIFQIAGLGGLAIIGKFSLVGIAIVRTLTEIVLVVLRGILCIKYKGYFSDIQRRRR